jgi:hypothetical protein
MWTTLVFATAGGASIGGALGHRWSHRDDRWLAAWAVLGLIFLLALRFTASRYWLPFFPALVLLSLQRAHPRLIQLAVFLTLLLSAGLAVDDHDLAQVQQDMAQKVIGLEEEGGRFAGHWGWQHHLQSSAWIPLEEDSPVPEGKLLAVSSISWPQAPAAGCYELVICVSASPRPFAPRVHAPADGANFHAFMGSALPPSGTAEHPCSSPPTQAWGLEPLESYAPWTFSPSAQEVLTLWRSCRAEPGS